MKNVNENVDIVHHFNLNEHESMSINIINFEMQKRHENLIEIFQKIYISDEENKTESEKVRDIVAVDIQKDADSKRTFDNRQSISS